MAEIKQKLITPRVPNFIFIEGRQDGLVESPKIAVGELSDLILREIAEDWLKELLQVAKNQRGGQ